jgi:hypothetical protein
MHIWSALGRCAGSRASSGARLGDDRGAVFGKEPGEYSVEEEEEERE